MAKVISIPGLVSHKGGCAIPRECRLCGAGFIAVARKAFYCTLECRFWSKVDKRGPNECWPWMGYRKYLGYGQFSLADGCRVLASRISLGFHMGRELNSAEHALHRCDNPPCVNPAHLFVGDARANHLDCLSKGRFPDSYNRGSSNPHAKLTEAGVREIRRLAGTETYEEIGRCMGVSKHAVANILSGRVWSHVT